MRRLSGAVMNPRVKVPPVSSPVIERRTATDDDGAFLFELFCSSLPGNHPLLLLPEAERKPLLQKQFDARENKYRAVYALADFDVVTFGGEPVGNLYVDRGDDEFVIIDISILPGYRDRGIGTELVSSLLEEASRLVLPVRAHVLHRSPAWRLWKRLGFELDCDHRAYYEIVVPAIRTD